MNYRKRSLAPYSYQYVIDKTWVLFAWLALATCLLGLPVHAIEHTKIDAISEAARQFIVTQLGGDSDAQALNDTKITIKPLDSRLRLAACAEPLEVYKAPGTRLLGHSTVGVRCPSPAWSLFVPVHIEKQVPVLTLTRSIKRGAIVSAEDLVVRKRASSMLPAAYLHSGEELIGQQASRDLMPGVVLTRGMFKPQKLVRRGDRVTLSMKAGLVAVRVAGIAMSDGARGQRVRVKNLSTKRLVNGTVGGQNLVLVGHSAIR